MRLKRQNQANSNEVAELKSQVAENKAGINDLADKNRKATQIIEALNDDNENLRN